MEFLQRFHQRHEALKNYIHTAWRYPLPPWGRRAMGFVYFTLPVIGGYHVMQWAISKSHESIGENGEKLEVKELQGLGDKVVVDGEEKKIGGGGAYGGVKLAVSDEKTKQQNKVMLQAFLKQQDREFRKQERARRKEKQKLQKDEDPASQQ